VLLAVAVVELLDEFLGVIVDGVASEHGKTVPPIIEAHFVEELSEDHTEWTQSVASTLAEEFRVSLEDIFIHLKDHSFLLTVLLE